MRNFICSMGLEPDPGDAVVSQMDGVSAVFGAHILGKGDGGGERREEGIFTLAVREQERGEGGAMGMKGVDERSGRDAD